MTKPILIIGGGVIGCSIAYHLAKAGKKSIIIERDRIGMHASSVAAGILGAQVEMTSQGPLTDLCLASRAMFPQIKQELLEITGIDIELNHAGLLKIAMNQQEVNDLHFRKEWQQCYGQQVEWLDSCQVSQLEPHLSSEMVGALHLPDDIQVSAPRLVQAFACAAQKLGAEIYQECEVLELRREQYKITQVITKKAVWSVDWVILAAGVWSARLAQQMGIELPIYPLKGEVLAIRPVQSLLQKVIFTKQIYLVPKENKEIIIGATEKPYEMENDVSVSAVQYLLAAATRILPALSTGKIVRFSAGIRPACEDGRPIIGVSKECHNLFIASGHGRNGILLSPITGQLVVQIINDRKHALVASFQPDRFHLDCQI